MDKYPVYVNRLRKIVRVAELHHVNTLLLGAWGCGVFRNDPNVIAQAIDDALVGSKIDLVIHPLFAQKQIVDAFRHLER